MDLDKNVSIEIKKCTDCNTTKTPLWRAGPSGPKSLCNACGIRYRKTKGEEILGLNHGPFKKRKRSRLTTATTTTATSSSETSGDELREAVKMRVLMVMKKQRCQRRRRLLGEEEQQAAFSLMALSCGSVFA
ncbi:GATA transcription factor 23 [Mercurialis annua]|uniref:GATA transcription factor 23 n=1 Tax=Mercurialis annua TaxID=3986 RepID=UPI00215E59D6|nr:GATA transcription factor 23 [Mercurialis annua]